MRNYAVCDNVTNTASATVPMGCLTTGGSNLKRPAIFALEIGSDANAANSVKYALQRTTARGTSSSTVTPQDISGSDTGSDCTWDKTWSGNPTLTANAFLLWLGVPQTYPKGWMAAPGRELKIPATAGAGLALMSLVAAVAFNAVFTVHFEE
jgi:hypothetical protein